MFDIKPDRLWNWYDYGSKDKKRTSIRPNMALALTPSKSYDEIAEDYENFAYAVQTGISFKDTKRIPVDKSSCTIL